jgi:transcription elongation factor Elf1
MATGPLAVDADDVIELRQCWLYPPTVSGQLTCGNCGHSWWSSASSARTRCGACRTVVYVPAHVRNGASSGGVERPSIAPSHREVWNSEDDENPYSGATVLVVIGFVVIIVIAGVIWLRRDKAPTLFTRAVDRTARTSPAWNPYVYSPRKMATPSKPGYELMMGAMTRWYCGHEANLSCPLAPGVTADTAPCPFCGRPGIVGQSVKRGP